MFFKSNLKVALACALVGIGMVGSYAIGAHSQAKADPPQQQAIAQAQPATPQAQAVNPAPAQAPVVVNHDSGIDTGDLVALAVANQMLSRPQAHHTTVVHTATRAPIRTTTLGQTKDLAAPKVVASTPTPRPLSTTAPIASREERTIQRRLQQDGVPRQAARQATAELRANTSLPDAKPTRITNTVATSTSRSFTASTPTRSSSWSLFGSSRPSSSSSSSSTRSGGWFSGGSSRSSGGFSFGGSRR